LSLALGLAGAETGEAETLDPFRFSSRATGRHAQPAAAAPPESLPLTLPPPPPGDGLTQIAAGPVTPTPAAAPPAAADKPRNYYVRARGYRIVPDTDPPRYVAKDLGKTGIPYLDQAGDWLDLGIEHRMRFEYRENSFLRTPQEGRDYPFLLRSRLYVGVKNIFDPFRFAVEFQDSRWENSIYENTNREVNEREPIQVYGELHFKHAFGLDRPMYVRAGRMAFELVDRRLIANNEFRNTSNTFQGIRAKIGEQTNDWELDMLWMQPIDRLLYQWDKPVRGLWFYGLVGSWRRWSEYATIQPYWLGLTQNSAAKVDDPEDTYSIQTTGIRSYGVVGETGWDWDIDLVYQFGKWKDDLTQNAWASALEIGYTVEDWSWKPRFSGFFAYGSGDRNPNDRFNNNFNSLYGFNQPWSRNDYFSWDNAIQPKARIETTPVKNLLVDLGYGAFWLASSRAPWQRAELSDPSGRAGNWLGNEFDVRLRYRIRDRVQAECSYARFNPGTFPKDTGKPLDSNFFYFQVTVSPFGWK